jgi:pimeloyl-ACP methyl ester carboxylesterase
MVLPGGSDSSVPLAIAPDDLRQLADHDARPRTFAGGAGPLAALDTGADDVSATALLVAGYTGSKEDFAPILGPLSAAGLRVVAYDQPGQYESPGPDDPAGYAFGALAAVTREVADQLDGPVHLLGHSLGGLVARAAVLADPARWTSLVLMDSGQGAPVDGAGGRRERLDVARAALPHGMAAIYDAMQEWSRAQPGWQPEEPAVADYLRRRFVASSPAGLVGMGEALLAEPDRTAELAAATAAAGLPVLVLYGADDDAWSPAAQAAMAARLGAATTSIPDAAHSPAVENPAATARAMLDFWLPAA